MEFVETALVNRTSLKDISLIIDICCESLHCIKYELRTTCLRTVPTIQCQRIVCSKKILENFIDWYSYGDNFSEFSWNHFCRSFGIGYKYYIYKLRNAIGTLYKQFIKKTFMADSQKCFFPLQQRTGPFLRSCCLKLLELEFNLFDISPTFQN